MSTAGYAQTERAPQQKSAGGDAKHQVAVRDPAPAGDALAASLNRSPRSQSLAQLRATLDESPRVQALQGLTRALNRTHSQDENEPGQRQQKPAAQFATLPDDAGKPNDPPPVHKKPNATGLPDRLKAGVEQLSGLALDDVRVHYNSSKPAAVQAHAYAQGTDIHVAPGQEKHLPHEAWHVVQQKHGRVKPTLQMKGVAINDDAALEREADAMGGRAKTADRRAASDNRSTIQRSVTFDGKEYKEGDLEAAWQKVAPVLADRGVSPWGRKKKLGEHLRAPKNEDKQTLSAYVDFLIQETPRRSEQGRGRPDWDPFWKSVTTGGLHRRHVVMSSVMRNAVYSVTDSLNGIKDAKERGVEEKGLVELYQDLTGNKSSDLKDLEGSLVSRLHNHKLNIFIGPGGWNSAIGGISHAILPEKYFGELENADDFNSLRSVTNKFIEDMSTAGVFGHEKEKNSIVGVAAEMLQKIGTNWKGEAMSAPDLGSIKDELIEIIKIMSDSMASDVSESSNSEIKKHQNKLFDFNRRFLEIAKTGKREQLGQTVRKFFELEQLSSDSEVKAMDAITFFKSITYKPPEGAPKPAVRLAKNPLQEQELKGIMERITTPKPAARLDLPIVSMPSHPTTKTPLDIKTETQIVAGPHEKQNISSSSPPPQFGIGLQGSPALKQGLSTSNNSSNVGSNVGSNVSPKVSSSVMTSAPPQPPSWLTEALTIAQQAPGQNVEGDLEVLKTAYKKLYDIDMFGLRRMEDYAALARWKLAVWDGMEMRKGGNT